MPMPGSVDHQHCVFKPRPTSSFSEQASTALETAMTYPSWFVIGNSDASHRGKIDRWARKRAIPEPEAPESQRRCWCRRGDLNPHALAGTSPSSWRVCQFRHSDVTPGKTRNAGRRLEHQPQGDRGEGEHEGRHDRDAVQVLLDNG